MLPSDHPSTRLGHRSAMRGRYESHMRSYSPCRHARRGTHCASSAVAGRSTPTRRIRSRCCTRAEWRDRHLAAGKSYESAASRSFPRWTRHHVARWMRARSGRSATRLMSEMAHFPSTCGSQKGPRAAGASFLNERPISGRSIKRRERRGWALSRMGGLGRKRPGSFRRPRSKSELRPCAVRTSGPPDMLGAR